MGLEKFLSSIQKLVDQIEANLEFEVNIVELARVYDISPFHFQRLFKALVGDSLGRYIRGRRLTRAAEMLLETDIGLIDVAVAVGFNSHEAFTRSFKAYFQQTPKEFRHEKPRVVLSRKPILTMELFEYLKNGIQREPQIVQTKRQTIVGLRRRVQSPFLLEEKFCTEIDQTWAEIAARHQEIQNTVPGTFFGLTISESGLFTEEYVDYFAGMAIVNATTIADVVIPQGMSAYEIPEGKFGLFEQYEPKNEKYKATVDCIYGYWLPNSNYTRGRGVDYVRVDEMYDFGKPGSVKYVVPLSEKN